MTGALRKPGAISKEAIVRLLIAMGLFCAYAFAYLVPLQMYFANDPSFSLDPSWAFFACGVLCVAIIAVFLPTSFEVHHLFLWLIFAIVVIPRMVTSSLGGESPSYALLCLAVFSVTAVASNRMRYDTPSKMLGSLRSSRLLVVVLSFVALLTIGLFVWCATSLGVPSLDALNYENVYEIRGSNSFDFVESGLLTLVCTRIIPAVLCYLVVFGCWWAAALFTVVQFVFFLWTANKAWLLIPVLVWVVGILLRYGFVTVKRLLVGLLVMVIVLSAVACFSRAAPMVVFSICVRRLLILPAVLGQCYFNFFSAGNPTVMLQNTILSPLTPMPEQYSAVSYAVQIGQFLYGNESTSYANTGLFGGEIANFGPVFGLVIAGVNLFIICCAFRIVQINGNKELVCAFVILFAFLLLNASTIRLMYSPTGLVGTLFMLYLAVAPPPKSRRSKVVLGEGRRLPDKPVDAVYGNRCEKGQDVQG